VGRDSRTLGAGLRGELNAPASDGREWRGATFRRAGERLAAGGQGRSRSEESLGDQEYETHRGRLRK
jgi:hypothetical protein